MIPKRWSEQTEPGTPEAKLIQAIFKRRWVPVWLWKATHRLRFAPFVVHLCRDVPSKENRHG